MELDVLGHVRLRIRDQFVELRPSQELTLLVILALSGNQAVAHDVIADRLWDGARDKRRTLYSYASRLRGLLEQAGGDRSCVQQRSGGYQLRIDDEAVDWRRFRRLCSSAAALTETGADTDALALLSEALSLWRGDPLAGVPGSWAGSVRETMENAHQSAVAQWARIGLRLRPPAEVIAVLGDALERYPLNQALTSLLMQALGRDGRTTEALAAYQRLRRRLADEAGLDPAPELQATFVDLLRGGDAPSPPPSTPPTAVHSERGPARDNLERDLADFTSRDAEVAEVLAAVRSAAASAATGVCVISGMPGVGKSSLAIHVAHRIKAEYSDGCLYVGLRAHAGRYPPLNTTDAVAELLSLLDVPPERIPPSLGQRIALLRHYTATKRILIVLDDALNADQVGALLPGGPDCMVLVTARRRLHELDGAHHLSLAPPEPDKALDLFAAVARRSRGEIGDAGPAIVAKASSHPLALRLVAAKLRTHPSWTAEDILARLREAEDGLNVFRAGQRSLEAVFELSLRTLSAPARTAFLQLGLHPGAPVDRRTAAAVIGQPLDAADTVFDELSDAHLIEEHERDLFRQHALLSVFAHHRARVELTHEQQRKVHQRMLTHYLATCATADRVLSPHRLRLEIPADRAQTSGEVPSQQEATAWFKRHAGVLPTVLRFALDSGFEVEAARITNVVADYYDRDGPWDVAVELHRRAISVWHAADRPAELAYALYELGRAQVRMGATAEALASAEAARDYWSAAENDLGVAHALSLTGRVHWIFGRFDLARDVHDEALARFRSLGHRPGVAMALKQRADVLVGQGNCHPAISDYSEAIVIFESLHDVRGLADAKGNLAGTYQRLGKYRDATALCEEILILFHELGDRRREGIMLANLADLTAYRGDNRRALALYADALARCREVSDRWAEAATLCNLGRLHLNSGDIEQAQACFEQSRDLSDSVGDPRTSVEAVLGLADTAHRQGRVTVALERHRHAVDTASQSGLEHERAQALMALGRVLLHHGHLDGARRHLEQAEEVLTRLDLPDKALIRALLDTIPQKGKMSKREG
ncbi:AfsR/SARP family transcriptional regulator [Marinactinospora rubrisoli]|uniref:Tetratricopeptide repeat protein n=1 Tax=Marinactinospora rubrisoli TaxID=2715399 RepID=A0ABW2KGY2_9ACTN